jgi:hypothetical protein
VLMILTITLNVESMNNRDRDADGPGCKRKPRHNSQDSYVPAS